MGSSPRPSLPNHKGHHVIIGGGLVGKICTQVQLTLKVNMQIKPEAFLLGMLDKFYFYIWYDSS